MLIPITFKNNDKPAVTNEAGEITKQAIVTKIGKVTPAIARMIYANALSTETGIIQEYKSANASSCSIATYETVGNKIRVTFNKGAFSIYGGIGIIESGTTFDIDKSVDISNGSLGVRVNLGNEAGEEMSFYAKDANTLQKDNLLLNEQNGIYDFELYKFTLTNGVFVLGTKNTTDIVIPNNNLLDDIISGEQQVGRLKTSKITANSIEFRVGDNTIYMRW